jgi:nucleoside-diphosphate-sugar epimerase
MNAVPAPGCAKHATDRGSGSAPSGFCLVTGGSGFLGINLVRSLLARGIRVRTLDIAPFDYPERERIEACLGDIRDAVAVEQAMHGVDVVVHAAAALPLAPPADILSTGIDGTRVLLEAAARHAVSRFIFISSTAVYGIPDHHPVAEDSPLNGVGPYGRAKVEAERLCRGYRGRGLCVSILRPKSFVGPERLGVFELLYDWAFDGHNFPVLGSGDNLYQLLDVEDLCDVIWLCMTRPVAEVDDTFNVGAAEVASMRENVQSVLDRAGHGGRVVSLPAAPATMALRVLEVLHLSPLYRWVYDTASRDSVVSIDRLRERVGFTPRHSNRQALARNYDWYVEHRSEFSGRVGVTHRVPWRRGLLRLAEWVF